MIGLWRKVRKNIQKFFFTEEDPSPIAEKVDHALTDHGYEQLYSGLFIALTAGTIILLGAYRADNSHALILWYSIFFVVNVLRIVLIKLFQYERFTALNYAIWKKLFIISAFFGGCTWGLAGILLFPSTHMVQQVLVVLTIAGVSAGSISTLSAIPKASFCFLIATLTPFIINIASKTHVFSWIVIIFLVFLAYLFLLTVRTHLIIRNLIYLNFENISLLENLSHTNQKLSNWAMYDPLTKIANRRVFYINLENAIKKAKQDKSIVALLYIDLDKFKVINDTYGHDIGDKVLYLVGETFKRTLRGADMIARVGGDEFTVILEKIKSKHDVKTIANKLSAAIERLDHIDDLPITLGLSIGVSFYPLDGEDPEALIKAADEAMYYVKKHGRHNVHFLD